MDNIVKNPDPDQGHRYTTKLTRTSDSLCGEEWVGLNQKDQETTFFKPEVARQIGGALKALYLGKVFSAGEAGAQIRQKILDEEKADAKILVLREEHDGKRFKVKIQGQSGHVVTLTPYWAGKLGEEWVLLYGNQANASLSQTNTDALRAIINGEHVLPVTTRDTGANIEFVVTVPREEFLDAMRSLAEKPSTEEPGSTAMYSPTHGWVWLSQEDAERIFPNGTAQSPSGTAGMHAGLGEPPRPHLQTRPVPTKAALAL